MAAPIAPTAVSICTEALRKAGIRSPVSADIERARTEFLEEVKADIWALSKKLTSLHTESISIVRNGQGRYPNPTDFSSLLSVSILSGQKTGTVISASASGMAVGGVDDRSTDLGKKVVITSGTGKSSLSQIIGWDNVTNAPVSSIVTVTPSWTRTPANGDGYLVVDQEHPLEEVPVWRYDREDFPGRRGPPHSYTPIGDADDGEILLAPVPDQTYAIRMRYYADLLRLDLAGTRMATLYRRWRTALTDGVAARAMASDDPRWKGFQSQYRSSLQSILLRESYGQDLSNLQCQVVDY